MTKQTFKTKIILSTIVTAIVIALIAAFSVLMFQRYSLPTDRNTFLITGTVNEVYFTATKGETMIVEMSNRERVQLVYPNRRALYSAIGYDIEELADLLEGKTIQCRRMNDLPWAVEIVSGDIEIDNYELTAQQIKLTRVGIAILGLIVLAISVGCDISYLKVKYACYEKEKRKQFKKEKRQLRKYGEKNE